jgi:hypothetical protein
VYSVYVSVWQRAECGSEQCIHTTVCVRQCARQCVVVRNSVCLFVFINYICVYMY